MLKTKAFSLVELMVVIAIVAILATVGSVSYQSYVARASVQKSISITRPIMNQLVEYYNRNGTSPPSITFAGYTANMYSSMTFSPTIENIVRIQYANNTPTNGTQIILRIGPLPGVPGTSGVAGVVGLGFRFVNNVVQFACGNPGNGETALDAAYLPSNCTCTNVDSWARGGANPSGCPS